MAHDLQTDTLALNAAAAMPRALVSLRQQHQYAYEESNFPGCLLQGQA
jgi:hypothetical protein